MRNWLRIATAAIVATGTFFASALGIEVISWWWLAPHDPLADPAINELRFVTAFTLAFGTAGAVLWPARRAPAARLPR